MISHKLWRTLRTPTFVNPILRRAVVFSFDPPFQWPLSPDMTSDLLIGCILVMAFIRFELVLILFAIILLMPMLIVIGIPLSFPILTSLVGAIWSSRMGCLIAREHERGRHDLLSISGGGSLGVNWTICKACIHHGEAFALLNSLARIIALVGMGIFTLAIVLITLTNAISLRHAPDPTALVGVKLLAELITLIGAAYIYYIQTIVLSALVGVLVPSYTKNFFEASAGAFVVNLAVQAVTCAAALFLATRILPIVHDGLHISGWLDTISRPVYYVAIFYFLREAVILWLWRTLTERLNADPVEFRDPIRLVRGC